MFLDSLRVLDVRAFLPRISVPTLVIHRRRDRVPIEGARYMASRIPGARLVELEGNDHIPWLGDMDALVLNMNDPPSLLRNDGGSLQNWIKIKLIGTKCNRTAIGARVRVVTGKHAQMDEVHSGTSVMSQSDLRLHFGLGEFQTVDLIEVRWPTTQKVERFTKAKANQILTIREGGGIVSAYVPKSK